MRVVFSLFAKRSILAAGLCVRENKLEKILGMNRQQASQKDRVQPTAPSELVWLLQILPFSEYCGLFVLFCFKSWQLINLKWCPAVWLCISWIAHEPENTFMISGFFFFKVFFFPLDHFSLVTLNFFKKFTFFLTD